MKRNNNYESMKKTYNDWIRRFSLEYNELIEIINRGEKLLVEIKKSTLNTYLNNILELEEKLKQEKVDIDLKGHYLKQKYQELLKSYMFIGNFLGEKIEIKEQEGEYINNGSVNIDIIPPEKALEAAIAYGEGYQPLIDALENCIRNGIRTFASCAGHEESPEAYIGLIEGNLANSVVEKLLDSPYINMICLSRNPLGFNSISIYAPIEKREKFFTTLSELISRTVSHQNETQQ